MSLERATYKGNSLAAATVEHEQPADGSQAASLFYEQGSWMRWGLYRARGRERGSGVPRPRIRRFAIPRIAAPRVPHASRPRVAGTAAVPRTHLLRPRLPDDAIPRSRLLAVLERGRRLPLTLVCGPAGAGKTTLLGQWLAALPPATPSAAWLSLSERTSRLPAFAHALVAALQTVAPSVGRQTLALLAQRRPVPPAVLGRRLADELLALTEDVLLVLDDYHTISDGRVHTLVGTLLEHPSPKLHLVLASRYDPPLPLVRLRAQGEMLEVRDADLRFTLEETSAFLQAAVGSVDGTTATRLQARTEGWAAGVRLAALSLVRPQAPPADTHHLRMAPALEFLVTEVLNQQPPALQAFLLRTAALERLSAPLGDALLAVPLAVDGRPLNGPARRMSYTSEDGAATSLLAEALRRNLFLVPVDAPARAARLDGGPETEESGADVAAQSESGPAWYRYHQLFREALRHRLRTQDGEVGVQALRAIAGQWLAAHGLVDGPVRSTLATGHLAAASTVDVHEARPAPAEDSQSAGSPPTGFPAPVANGQALIEQLTYREEQVLAGLMRRLSNKEIAHELGIALSTVKRHVANLYSKLGVGSRREAERLANSRGWVPFPATDGAAEGWPPGKVATSPR